MRKTEVGNDLCCHLDGVTLNKTSDIKDDTFRYQRVTFSDELKKQIFCLCFLKGEPYSCIKHARLRVDKLGVWS